MDTPLFLAQAARYISIKAENMAWKTSVLLSFVMFISSIASKAAFALNEATAFARLYIVISVRWLTSSFIISAVISLPLA